MMVNYFPGELDSVPDSAVKFAEQMILYTCFEKVTTHPLLGIFLTGVVSPASPPFIRG